MEDGKPRGRGEASWKSGNLVEEEKLHGRVEASWGRGNLMEKGQPRGRGVASWILNLIVLIFHSDMPNVAWN